jgi:hypothetical protein
MGEACLTGIGRRDLDKDRDLNSASPGSKVKRPARWGRGYGMKRLALLGAIALFGSGAVGTSEFASAGPVVRLTRTVHADYSRNWAGYDAIGVAGDYHQVSASWTQPTVTCPATDPNSYSSFWVGLDGGVSGNRTVEQTGTEADCINHSPSYYAWYEVFPKAAHPCSITVDAGDSISASVDYDSTLGLFTLLVTDSTHPGSCGTTFSLRRAQLSTAEVIAEAPAGSHSPVFGILPLANFGTVSFTGAEVNSGSLSAATPDEVIMTSDGLSTGTLKADPGSLSVGSFDVVWHHS